MKDLSSTFRGGAQASLILGKKKEMSGGKKPAGQVNEPPSPLNSKCDSATDMHGQVEVRNGLFLAL